MNEHTPSFATRMPFISPSTAANSKTTIIAKPKLMYESSCANNIPHSVRFEPTDISNSPAMSVNVMPKLMIPWIDICRNRFCRLSIVKNIEEAHAANMITITRITNDFCSFTNPNALLLFISIYLLPFLREYIRRATLQGQGSHPAPVFVRKRPRPQGSVRC